jgi:hypothetical protein
MISGLEMFGEMLSVLEEKPESWKLEHLTAMPCCDLEDILTAFNATFHAIREASHRGSRPGAPEHPARHETIENLYRRWRDAGSGLQSPIQRFKELEHRVDGSDEFLKNLAEVERFLKDADRAAIIEQRIGLCDMTLTHEAAEQLSQILDGGATMAPRPAYEPKAVPLADVSVLIRKH